MSSVTLKELTKQYPGNAALSLDSVSLDVAHGEFICLVGPSGCGKTTLHKALLASPVLKGKLVKSISATTRNKRPGERDGRDYLFLTPKVFEERIKKNYFLVRQLGSEAKS